MMFGHEEILQKLDRKCRVVAQTNCTLMYLNKADFLQGVPPEFMQELIKTMINFDADQIADRIES